MNFLRVLKEVCSGTTIFPQIADYPLRRTLLHLGMLAILLSLFIACCQYWSVNRFRERLDPALHKEFGELVNSKDGLRPALHPETARTLALTNRVILNYFPDANIKTGELRTKQYDMGLLWTPGAVLCWQNKGGNSFLVWPLLITPMEKVPLRDLFPSSTDGIAALVKKIYHPAPMEPEMDIRALLLGLLWSYTGVIYLVSMLRILFFVLLFTTLFTGCYSLAGGAASTGLRFKQIFTIGIYAGFPALMVASVIPAFDIDLIDFNTVYLFGFLAYFLFVFSRIQRQRLQERLGTRPEGKDDDDEF